MITLFFQRLLRVIRILMTAMFILWLTGFIVRSCGHFIVTDGSDDYFKLSSGCFLLQLLVIYKLRVDDTLFIWFLKLVSMFALALAAWVLMIFLAFADMCSESIDATLFVSKTDASSQIIETDFGCGATDTSPAQINHWRAIKLSPHIYWIREPVDTAHINTTQWHRIQPVSQP
ncbi:MAG: hypothetical protein JST90_16765 [Bacteroidetes bacterium]|nr:hypothetical protein [Bacteroidota bacterium]